MLLKIAEKTASEFSKFPGKSSKSIVSGQGQEIKSLMYGLTFLPTFILPLIWAHNELFHLVNWAENYTFWLVAWQLNKPLQLTERSEEY